jgi:hypothetical protein
MTAASKQKTQLSIVGPDIAQLEAVVVEAAQQTAPMVQRYQTHKDRIQVATNELLRERADLEDRRALLRRQFDAVDAGLCDHINDIDATLGLYPQPAA